MQIGSRRHVVLLLQHTNIVGEDVPGDVQQAFGDHVWGATDEPVSSVAVVAHRRWKVKQKFCHPSGRVLGVELAAGESVLRVVSVYCPTNLDYTSTYPVDRRRKAANEMVDAAVRWATQAEVCFIGGDFNESAVVNDRRMGGEAPPLRAERLARNTINSVVLHPGTGLADVHAFVNGSTRAFTRSDYRGGLRAWITSSLPIGGWSVCLRPAALWTRASNPIT